MNLHESHLPTLVHTLRYRAHTQTNQIGFTFLKDGEQEGDSITFGGLDRRARAIAVELLQLCKPGDRALLLYPPGIPFIEAFFGCLYAGVIATPTYPPRSNRKGLSRIRSIMADAGATLALTTAELVRKLSPQFTGDPEYSSIRLLATDSIHESSGGAWLQPSVLPDNLAFLQYTSGSTGDPKGVMVSHSNLMHNLEVISRCFGHTPESKGVIWLPPYHDMGLIGGILQPVYVGGPVVLMPPVEFIQKPLRWLEAISTHRATTSGGPNFAYELCARKITPEQRTHLDLSCWDLAFVGAEPVRAETLERFVEAFGPCGFRREALYPCYGMAETTLIISGGLKASPPVTRAVEGKSLERNIVAAADDPQARKIVGCGRSLTGHQILIVDPELSRPVPDGRVGEIWVSGPSVAQGYWGRNQETENVFQARLANNGGGPFLRTGDLGYLENGELYVTGRSKDLIIIRGRNHYPQDIERTVEGCYQGLRPGCGAAFSVDIEGEERLVVVQEVERERLRHLNTEEAIGAIRRSISEQHDLHVHAVLLVKTGSVPKTTSGKVQRYACRGSYVEGGLDAVGSWREEVGRREEADSLKVDSLPPPDASSAPHDSQAAIRNWLVVNLAARLKISPSTINPQTPFADYGLDSLQAVTISGDLSDWLGQRLSPELLYEYPDIEALSRYLSVVHDVTRMLDGLTSQERRGLLTQLSEDGPPLQPDEPEESPARFYSFEEWPEYRDLQEKRAMLMSVGIRNPFFTLHEGINSNTTLIEGREYINYSSNNYLGMCEDAAVSRFTKEAVDRYGTGVSASRVVSGERPVHRELESELANLIGVEDCLVFVGGNSTNVTTVGHLFGKNDLILYDELSHDSLLQGAILSGATALPFPHNDWRTADTMLNAKRQRYEKVLIFIEGIYSMDGDIPDLPKFIEVKEHHKAMLMVDECLSIGVLGEHGRGIGEYCGVDPRQVELWMGGISKAFASCGGYIAGSHALIEYLKYTAPGFVYTTGMTPANAAAALAAIRLLKAEPERVERLHRLSKLFLDLARERGLNVGRSKDTPVIPIIVEDAGHCLQIYQQLFESGINVQPILYPAVPADASRLRFFISCVHTEEQIRFTVNAVADALAKLRDPR